LLEVDAVPVLVRAIRECYLPVIVEWSIATISQISIDDDCAILVTPQALVHVVEAMKRFPNSTEIQSWSCTCLRNLTFTTLGRRLAMDAGILSVLESGIATHLSNLPVCEWLIRVSINMAFRGTFEIYITFRSEHDCDFDFVIGWNE
jgi:hypothetical protein